MEIASMNVKHQIFVSTQDISVQHFFQHIIFKNDTTVCNYGSMCEWSTKTRFYKANLPVTKFFYLDNEPAFKEACPSGTNYKLQIPFLMVRFM